MESNWISTSVVEDLPMFPVLAGHDTDGDAIYLARSEHNGDILPAKYIPNKKQAYVPWGGMEHSKHNIDVLTGENYAWVEASGGNIPSNAVIGGRTSDGETLYIGRGHWAGSLTPGKVQPSHGCLYVPYGSSEHRLENYEILIRPESWIRSSGSNIIPGTVHGGNDVDGTDIYVGRAYHENNLLPAKVIPSKCCAYVCYRGQEHVKYDFELLVGYGYGWVNDTNGNVPNTAVSNCHTCDGENLYIGRAIWCGSLTVGKIQKSHGCLYIPFAGQEIRITNYEVLVRV